MEKNIIAAIDIGCHKISVLIAEALEGGELRIIGISTEPSDGIRRGVVVNIDKAAQAIARAVQNAESISGVTIRDAWVNVAGRHLISINSKATITVALGAEISHEDVDRAVEHATAMNISHDRLIIHKEPKDFTVDNNPGVKDPAGMTGRKIEADVHMVVAGDSSINHVIKCVAKAGVKVNEFPLPNGIASALAILDKDDLEIGVLVIDIGGGTTDLSVYKNEALQFTTSVDLGGEHITNDIATTLRTTIVNAEKLKKSQGACIIPQVGDTHISLPGSRTGEPREIPRSHLVEIINARVIEIFQIALQELQAEGYFIEHSRTTISRVRITGGTSLLDGIEWVARDVFNNSVHFVDDISVAWPQDLGGLAEPSNSPMYSTGVGLLVQGLRQQSHHSSAKSESSGPGLLAYLKKAYTAIKNQF